MQRIVAIGAGGIFSQSMMPLCQYLNYKYQNKFELVICDGDKYEESNLNRQIFNDFDNKAIVASNLLQSMFNDIKITAIDEFVTKYNIEKLILEKDLVFICVDNNNSRNLIQEHCLTLNECTVISGGNDYLDGNVMTFGRKKGKTIGKVFTELHKEIGNGKDKSPAEMSCQELAKSSSPQLVITNYNVASIMLNEVYSILEKGKFHNEVFTDIAYNCSRSSNECKHKIKV